MIRGIFTIAASLSLCICSLALASALVSDAVNRKFAPTTMIDPSTWTQKKIPVPSLQLDPSNPRIPERQTPPTQAELIAELVANDGVYELAKDITEVGYLPDSSLIAVYENGKHVVVEGNRRLTALKLLVSPTLAPLRWPRLVGQGDRES
jgi:hypothetical protein